MDAYTGLIDRFAVDPCYSDPHFAYDPQNLYSALTAQDHKVYVSSDGGETTGIFAWVILPEDQYAELIVGFSKSADAWEEILDLIERENPGFQLDFVINPRHDALRGVLQSKGAVFEKEQKKLRLVKEVTATDAGNEDGLEQQLIYAGGAPAAEGVDVRQRQLTRQESSEEVAGNVGILQQEHEPQYSAVHTKDTYWTAERILEARDRFRVFTAVEQGKMVGYLDITTGHSENEPYDLWTAPGFERYRKALLVEAIRRNRPNGMMVVIDTDDAVEISLYESVGFEAIEGSESVYATYRAGMYD